MPKFSMILPMHNSAGFARRMLDSIVAQNYTDYELICVCDACEDDSAALARSYGARVEEVDFRRAGLSRNRGLEVATGEWVLFADDDDWLLHEYVFSQIAERAGINGAELNGNAVDILAMSFIWKGQGYTRNTPATVWPAVWNKAWRREFIGDTRFSDKKYGDDADFTNAMLAKNPTIMFWDFPIYYYDYLRPDSLSEKIMRGEKL